MEGKTVYVVASKRTPIGAIGGKISKFRGPELAQLAIRAALSSINLDPAHVEEVILGNVCSAGVG
jgi:acetyl-CoA C-acetyltransferase